MKKFLLIPFLALLAFTPIYMASAAGLESWSTTPGDNDAPPPNGAPEGMAPSGVNDTMRQIMAGVRAWFEDFSWTNLGTAGLSYETGTQFSATGNVTTTYHVGRRVKAYGTGFGTIYGTISVTNYSAPDTTVTVVWDSGALDATLATVWIGTPVTGKPIPYNAISDIPVVVVPVEVETGMMMPYVGTTAPTGYVLCSGKTIGNASSNGTARANADTEDLFTLLWNSFANTELPIYTSGGVASTRGASAAADYAANKALAVPDLRDRVIAGYGSMGGTAASRLTGTSGGVEGDTMGATGGAQQHTLTTAEMPAHNHNWSAGGSSGSGNAGALWGNQSQSNSTSSTGGGGAHNNVQPTIILPYIIKL
jgi:microcystin-dependent protein